MIADAMRTEDEIIATWTGDASKPLVSIRCITYNHAPYIEDAIKGFLLQKTDFPIEILIHDDASTDGAKKIIEKYQERYPKIIRAVIQKENQYSKGIKVSEFINPLCKGKYYAICEGDDFWNDPDKLSKQVTALESNPSVDICIHPAIKISMETGEEQLIGQYRKSEGIVPVEDIIEKKHGRIPTASTMIRATAYAEYSGFRATRKWLNVGDVYTHIFGSKKGGAYYLDATMSCYRHLVPGSWTANIRAESGEEKIKKSRRAIKGYEELNEVTVKRFESSFNNRMEVIVRRLMKAVDVNFTSRLAFLYNNMNHLSYKCILHCALILLLPRPLIKARRNKKMMLKSQ